MRKWFLLLIFLISPLVSADEKVYTFGVVPQQSASKLAKLWSPILRKLSQETGMTIKFATAPTIPEFEMRLSKGEYDFAYMNPYHFVVFNKLPGYQAMNKAKDKAIKGVIVARKDSNITSLDSLSGKTLAFPAPAAFAASILTREHLASTGVVFQPQYVSSHDSVYISVARGLYPAGGGVVRTFNNVSPKIRDELEIVWTTKGFTPHAIAASPSIAEEDRVAVQQAISTLDSSELGAALLKKLSIKGFESAENQDWDDVRKLKISMLGDL